MRRVRREPDPRVADFKADDGLGFRLSFGGHPNDNFTVLREFDGVPHQIDQHLAKPPRVTLQRRRHILSKEQSHPQSLALGIAGQDLQDPFRRLAQVEFEVIERQFSRLDLGEIQNVGDDAHQELSALRDRLDTFSLFGGQRRVLKQMSHADHSVHGRPDLMAHVGHKLRLQPGRFQGRIERLGELDLVSFPFGDIARDSQIAGQISGGVAQGRHRKQHGKPGAVFAKIGPLILIDLAEFGLCDEGLKARLNFATQFPRQRRRTGRDLPSIMKNRGRLPDDLDRRIPQPPLRRVIESPDHPVRVGRNDRVVRPVEDRFLEQQTVLQRLLHLPLTRDLPAQLQLGDDLSSQAEQRRPLSFRQLAGDTVDDAKGSEDIALGGQEWSAGIETNLRTSGDEGIGRKPAIERRVGHHEKLLLQDGVRAERQLPGRLRSLQTHLRFEPLTIGIDQRDQGDRHVANRQGEKGDVVETFLGRRIEDFVLAERGQAGRFVGRKGRAAPAQTSDFGKSGVTGRGRRCERRPF